MQRLNYNHKRVKRARDRIEYNEILFPFREGGYPRDGIPGRGRSNPSILGTSFPRLTLCTVLMVLFMDHAEMLSAYLKTVRTPPIPIERDLSTIEDGLWEFSEKARLGIYRAIATGRQRRLAEVCEIPFTRYVSARLTDTTLLFTFK